MCVDEVEFGEVSEDADIPCYILEWAIIDPELLERLELCDDGWEGGDGVVGEVEFAELCEASDGVGQFGDGVVGQIQNDQALK